MHKVAFIVATKDRPNELRKMLESIASGSVFPDEIIIVDGGQETVEPVIRTFPGLNIRYLRFVPPSAVKQRNFGIRSVSPGMTLVGFFDDDIVLPPNSLERMMAFWNNADENIGGAAFNMINHPSKEARVLKSLKIVECLGLYSSQPGVVMRSGFQTMIGTVGKTIRVQWLPSGASVFRREILSQFVFDEWFEGYSYLEDLDFSYRVGKKFGLAVVAEGGYFHYPSPWGRGRGVKFGCREVINRVYFVKKNKELSLLRCYLGLLIRLAISLMSAFKSVRYYNWQRACGNCVGFAALIMGRSLTDALCKN